MSIFTTGDKHGEMSIQTLSKKDFPYGVFLTRKDYVVITGDFGLLWNNPIRKQEKYWLNWLSEKKWTTLVVDGNHENFELFDTLPTQEMFGSDVGVICDNVYHLRRGRMYNIDGFSCFTFGGGESIDKMHRIPGRSWWSREIPSYLEMESGMDTLDTYNWKCDYVFTHVAPLRIFDHMVQNNLIDIDQSIKNCDPVSKYFNELIEKLDFKEWRFGHYHEDIKRFQVNGCRGYFACGYDDVHPLFMDERLMSRLDSLSNAELIKAMNEEEDMEKPRVSSYKFSHRDFH